jgi:hypothetical protein
MSETTFERLKRLNSPTGEVGPVEANDAFWTKIAQGMDERIGNDVQAMSDFQIGVIVGGVIERILNERESQ